ncbi:UNVERIFIED_CONTAM: Peroxidase 2 [Sesamum radiatum]|uniref:peroxidase n=1 Tax=Sesamum radiatum TaxID=300843 RepID=A0AAW2L4B1_SESRA
MGSSEPFSPSEDNYTRLTCLCTGAHTIGQARCVVFRDRIYNESDILASFATSLKSNCPSSGSNDSLSSMDATTPGSFDNSYFKNLVSNCWEADTRGVRPTATSQADSYHRLLQKPTTTKAFHKIGFQDHKGDEIFTEERKTTKVFEKRERL